ncbi:30S ribosomal protein S4 [Candidatus Falkowbacteria bacterium]|jgi:small subunit ribosomal protein S4|nr:30S ribosomal protein S4 [Candidatus Falkowbacteria bacterium]MBT4433552.1 30S ribosomal protein S4 [Candidatus Falkowbacteria bacterium]
MLKQPQCKICRREGKKLMLKGERCLSPKCAIVKRNYPPGLHGIKNTRRKISEYGKQLREKQKAKKIYGVLEKVFKKYYEKAISSKGNVSENLINLLEARLDNVVYRSGIASSRKQAKQLVGHGHFFLNKYKTDIPSCQVSIGDIIKIKESKKDKNFFKNLKESLKGKKGQEIPSWINFDKEKMEIKILSNPSISEMDQGFDTKMIIEFYSR